MTDDPGSLVPLINFLVGGTIGLLTLALPLGFVVAERPSTIPMTAEVLR